MEQPAPIAASPGRKAVFDLALFTKSPDPAPSPGAKGFLDLPPELRLRIYEYVTSEIVNYDDPEPPPGARVLPNIALAITCHQVYKEHITGARAAYHQTLGIDIVDSFDLFSIVGKRESGWSWGELWSSDNGWYGREVRHQITLAGGSTAYGWQGDPEAFNRRAIFEKKMERTDFYWKYESKKERSNAQWQHPGLFLEHIHHSACAPENLQAWKKDWPGSVFYYRPRGPKQHELGPITFKFVNATRQNAVAEANAAGPKPESRLLHNEEAGSNHDEDASSNHDGEPNSNHADNVNGID